MVSRSRNSIVGKDLVWFIVLEDVNCLGWNSVLLHHEVLKVKINVIAQRRYCSAQWRY